MALNTVVLTGNDSITMSKGGANRSLKNFAQGAIGQVTFSNPIAVTDVAKDGGIISLDVRGSKASLALRLLAGSADDNYFLNELSSFKANPTGYVMLGCSFIKNFGDGSGNTTKRTYTLNGGAVTSFPQATSDVNGDVEQAINVYTLEFVDSTISNN